LGLDPAGGTEMGLETCGLRVNLWVCLEIGATGYLLGEVCD
jgi:hypothetical protein